MNKFIYTQWRDFFSHPLFIILATPLTYLLTGTIYAAQIVKLSLLPFFMLYLFILINQFLEKMADNWLQKPEKVLTFILLVSETINLLVIIYFISSLNALIGLLLVLYSLLIQGHSYLIKIGMDWFSIFMQAIFKGGILTYLSFSIQLSFIPNTLFLWSIPLIVLALLIELGNYQVKLEQIAVLAQKKIVSVQNLHILFIGLLVFLYLSSFFILWPTFGYITLFLLLSIPMAVKVMRSSHSVKKEEMKRSSRLKQLSAYSIFFLLIFAAIVSTRFF